MPAGYRLHVDATQSRRPPLRAAARRRHHAPRATARRDDQQRLLADALALWRGPALIDFRYEPFAQTEITRLEALRLAALEQHIALELDVGLHAEACSELETLVQDHPLHEELHAMSMIALYRCGRQADALAVYERLRVTLRDELGLDPTPQLASARSTTSSTTPRRCRRVATSTRPIVGTRTRSLGRSSSTDGSTNSTLHRSTTRWLASCCWRAATGNAGEAGSRMPVAAMRPQSGWPPRVVRATNWPPAALGLAGPPEDTLHRRTARRVADGTGDPRPAREPARW